MAAKPESLSTTTEEEDSAGENAAEIEKRRGEIAKNLRGKTREVVSSKVEAPKLAGDKRRIIAEMYEKEAKNMQQEFVRNFILEQNLLGEGQAAVETLEAMPVDKQFALAMENGLVEAQEKSDEFREGMDYYSTMKEGLKGDAVPMEIQYVALDNVQLKFEEAKRKLDATIESGGHKDNVFLAEMELRKISQAREALVLNLFGDKYKSEALLETQNSLKAGNMHAYLENNFTEEAIGKKIQEKSEEVVNTQITEKDWNSLTEKQREEFVDIDVYRNYVSGKMERMGADAPALLKAGYKVQDLKITGFFIKTFEVPFGEKGEVVKMSKKEFLALSQEEKKNFDSEVKTELETSLMKEWVESIKSKEDQKIQELSRNIEFAKGGVEKMYQKAREKIVANIERELLAKEDAEKKEIEAKEEEGKLKEMAIKREAKKIKTLREKGAPGYEWKKIDDMLRENGIEPNTDASDRFMKEWDNKEAKKNLVKRDLEERFGVSKFEEGVSEFMADALEIENLTGDPAKDSSIIIDFMKDHQVKCSKQKFISFAQYKDYSKKVGDKANLVEFLVDLSSYLAGELRP